MPRYTQGNSVDPVTNIPIIGGLVRVTQNGLIRVLQTTGAPEGSINQQPGVPPDTLANYAAANPHVRETQTGGTRVTQNGSTRVTIVTPSAVLGLPYGFNVIPQTGPLPPEN